MSSDDLSHRVVYKTRPKREHWQEYTHLGFPVLGFIELPSSLVGLVGGVVDESSNVSSPSVKPSFPAFFGVEVTYIKTDNMQTHERARGKTRTKQRVIHRMVLLTALVKGAVSRSGAR